MSRPRYESTAPEYQQWGCFERPELLEAGDDGDPGERGRGARPAAGRASSVTAIGSSGSPQAVVWRRTAPALGLFLLAPITAEYLAAYDDSTGNLGELIGGLFLFAPLYGGAALLIREMTRRTGRGWPTIFLLGLAFGVAQAGLIDHSLFNPAYRDVAGWDEMFQATYVPGVGISLNPLTFATGHMIFSVAAPIALVEALVPGRARSPWLGRAGRPDRTAHRCTTSRP